MAEEVNQELAVREAVGVFMDLDELDHAVEDLMTEGFSQQDFSLLASDQTIEKSLGHRLVDTRSAADDEEVPRRSWPSPEAITEGKGALAGILGYVGAVTVAGLVVATGGAIATVVAAGVVAGGALAAAGVALGRVIDQRFAESLKAQVERGGILLWVRIGDDAQAETATRILRKHGAEDVHVHRLVAR